MLEPKQYLSTCRLSWRETMDTAWQYNFGLHWH